MWKSTREHSFGKSEAIYLFYNINNINDIINNESKQFDVALSAASVACGRWYHVTSSTEPSLLFINIVPWAFCALHRVKTSYVFKFSRNSQIAIVNDNVKRQITGF